MKHKYEDGISLPAVARELRFAVSTLNTIVTDAAHIKEHPFFIKLVMIEAEAITNLIYT
jgi:hypothetical protein